MYKAIVFAGTTEGYEISRFLSENKVSVLACVATEYGSRSLEENEFLSIRAERLDKEQMQELFVAERPELVLDATHPYAAEVTVNIREACENTAVSYVRVLREGGVHKDAVYVENTEAAVDYLKHVSGNVLLTTGSKELSAYTEIPGYQERMFARVLMQIISSDVLQLHGQSPHAAVLLLTSPPAYASCAFQAPPSLNTLPHALYFSSAILPCGAQIPRSGMHS